jgi:hypothetical protein
MGLAANGALQHRDEYSYHLEHVNDFCAPHNETFVAVQKIRIGAMP